MAANSSREVHRKTPLTHRKGKPRLRPMSLKALHELADKERGGKKRDAFLKEIARKEKKGLTYSKPEPIAEENTENG